MKSRYKDVPGFPGYRVGSDGSVWCCRSINGKGAFGRWRQKRLSKVTRFGHLRVDLYLGSNERHIKYVHRLVLEAFVGPCPEGMEACHNDGNPSNNSLSNLRWDTPKNNAADRVLHGTTLRGEDSPLTTLTKEDVAAIRSRIVNGETQRTVATDFGISQQSVHKIVRKLRWAHA